MSDRATIGELSRASVAVRVAVLILAIALPAGAAGESCLDVIHVEAPSDLGAELRAELQRSELDKVPALECVDARVSLSRDVPGYRVELIRASGRIRRSAEDIRIAAVWVDSWLRSGFAPEAPATDQWPAVAPAPAAARETPTAEKRSGQGAPPSPLVGAQPLGFAALAEDGALWAGPELGVRLLPWRQLWLGPEVGVSFDARTADGASRRVLRGGVAGGARFSLAGTVALYPGLSAGYATGTTTATTAVQGQAHGRGAYVSGACDVALNIVGPVSVFAGLGGVFFRTNAEPRTIEEPETEDVGENDDGEGVVLPRAVPAFLGGARLGVSLSLEGAP